MSPKEHLKTSVATLLHEHNIANVLDAIVEWHLEKAEQAPKAQARKLRQNAQRIAHAANDIWPTTIRGIYDETEELFN